MSIHLDVLIPSFPGPSPRQDVCHQDCPYLRRTLELPLPSYRCVLFSRGDVPRPLNTWRPSYPPNEPGEHVPMPLRPNVCVSAQARAEKRRWESRAESVVPVTLPTGHRPAVQAWLDDPRAEDDEQPDTQPSPSHDGGD